MLKIVDRKRRVACLVCGLKRFKDLTNHMDGSLEVHRLTACLEQQNVYSFAPTSPPPSPHQGQGWVGHVNLSSPRAPASQTSVVTRV
jgi:hypothetical protein